MSSRSVNRKYSIFALQLNEMAQQPKMALECKSVSDARHERASREFRFAGAGPVRSLQIVPFTIGLNAVRLSRSAELPKPLFGNRVVKLPCSPCSAM